MNVVRTRIQKGKHDDRKTTPGIRVAAGTGTQTAPAGSAESGGAAGTGTQTAPAGPAEAGGGNGGEAKTAPAGPAATGAGAGPETQTAPAGSGPEEIIRSRTAT